MWPDISAAYGSNPFLLRYFGLRDRLSGRPNRARARWGYLNPPGDSGKVIWIKTGGDPLAVRLAVELLGGLRHKRLDVRLVLTYEEEHREILESGLKGVKKIGFGFGPADAPTAIERTLSRLQPLGVISVGQGPRPNLARTLAERNIHHLVYATNERPGSAVEAFYPLSETAARQCRDTSCASHVAPAADPLSVITPAQVEPTLGGLLRGPSEMPLYWLHCSSALVRELPEFWKRSDFDASAVLVLSVDGPKGLALAEELFDNPVRLSRWQQRAVAPGSVVLVDEDRWLPAVAASVNSAHLQAYDRRIFWQAMAGGAPVSVGIGQGPVESLRVAERLSEVLELWRAYQRDPWAARREGDACRKWFWDERRRAQTVFEELLQRVYDW